MLATLTHLWLHLGWPLVRLLIFLGIGLLAALLIESLGWTKKLAAVARPLTRFARLPQVVGASFSISFVSGMAANTLLAESYSEGRISKKVLILANLFNSLPSNFTHLPTTFFIMVPIIRSAALVYLGLTLSAAIGRTVLIGVVARFALRHDAAAGPVKEPGPKARKPGFREAWQNTRKRFRKRIRKIASYTVPIYILFYALNESGFFAGAEHFMAKHLSWLEWISPQAISIITFQVVSEFTAGVAAAGALLQSGAMQGHEVVLALLAGNVLSSPVRALRHQYPYFAGIFRPKVAAELILTGQLYRACSIVTVMLLYLLCIRLNTL